MDYGESMRFALVAPLVIVGYVSLTVLLILPLVSSG